MKKVNITYETLIYSDKRFEHFKTQLIFANNKEIGHYQLADFDNKKENPKSYYVAIRPLKINKKLPIKLFTNDDDFRKWIASQFYK